MLSLKSLPLLSRGKTRPSLLSNALLYSFLQFPRSVSTGPTQRASLQRRIDQRRIREYLRHLDKILTADDRDDSVVSFNIQTKFSKHTSFRGPLRSIAFENVISLLLSRRRFSDACITYDRMVREGFKPRLFLRNRITAVKAITATYDADDPVEVLRTVFKQEGFDEECLGALIDLIPNTDDSELVWSIVKMFIETREPEYRPSTGFIFTMGRLEAKLGIKDGTPGIFGEDAVDRSGDKILSTHASALRSPEAYIDALNDATLSASDDEISAAYLSILSRMVSNNARSDPSVLNALMAYDLNRQAYERVFEFYNVLMRIRSRHLTPNAKTYILLFKAIKRIYNPLRTTRSRKHKRPRNVVPPRLLYKEMLECHLIHTLGRAARKSKVINVFALNAALRAFMAMRDYVAAFVVVRSFRVYGLRPDVQTYLGVVRPLLDRAKTRTDMVWAEQVLKKGDWEEENGWEQSGLTGFGMEKEVVRRLLKIGVNGGQVSDGEEMQALMDRENEDKNLEKEHKEVLKNFQRLMSVSERKRATENGNDDKDELSKDELDAINSLEGILYAGSEKNPNTEKPGSEVKSDGEKVLAMIEAGSSDSAQSHGRLQHSKPYGIPTLAMLLADAAPFPYVPKFFDITPLERILRRTIAASLPQPQPPSGQAEHLSNSTSPTSSCVSSSNTSRSISHLIRLVKMDMIPEKSALELRQRSRGVLDRRDGIWRFMKVKPR